MSMVSEFIVSYHQHDVKLDEVTLPPQIRCSEDRIKENGVYLLGKWNG